MNSSFLSTQLSLTQLEDRDAPALLSFVDIALSTASNLILPPPPPPPPTDPVVVSPLVPPAPPPPGSI